MAQASLSPRTAIAVASPTLLKSPAAQAAAVGVASSQLSAYVTIDPALISWQQLGVTPITENANTANVRPTLDALQRLAKQQGVEYIQITSGATQMLNLARQEAGTDQIHKGTDLPQAYTGKGVVVGVVDAGFDYMHAAFRRPADGALRIADGNIVLGFARDTQATLGITSMTGSTLFSKQLGKRSAGETLSVAVPQLPKGVYLLSVKTPTATKTFKFVWQ